MPPRRRARSHPAAPPEPAAPTEPTEPTEPASPTEPTARPEPTAPPAPLHRFEPPPTTPAFQRCFVAARAHLLARGDGALRWGRAHIGDSMLEHLSFTVGNQAVLVRLQGSDGGLRVPGTLAGLRRAARGWRGHACLMPMRRDTGAHGWRPALPGWGLLDARTRRPVDPAGLVTGAKVPMAPWELHDFAVQVVREGLERDGRRILSWHHDPGRDPSLWFEGDDGPEWVVVRAVRRPATDASPPPTLPAVARALAGDARRGHFASVGFANEDDPFDPDGRGSLPVWRAHGACVRYRGLQPAAPAASS